jgi:lipopolysaccharide export system permease protein
VTSIIKEGAFTSGFFDMLIYAEKVVSDENRLKGVLIFDEREPKSPMTYVAKEAELIPVRTQQELGSALILKLKNGAMHHSNPKNLTYEKIDFESYQLYLKISEGENSIIGKPQMIEQPKLLRLLQDPTTSPNFRQELRGEYWRRTALAISPFIFVVLGIGLATFRHRSARVESIWVGLGVALFYWTVQVWGTSAINSGTVSPWMGAQAANLVLLVVGLFAFRKACW